MAEGADRAVEAALGVGVVEVDGIGIGHHELHLAKRVRRPRGLAPALDGTGLGVFDRNEAALAGDFLRNARRHFPPRVEDDPGGHRAELRRGSLDRAGDSLVARHGDAVFDEGRGVGRDIDDDVARAEVARQPAPAVHVEADGVDLRRVHRVGQRDAKRTILGMGRQQSTQGVANAVLAQGKVEQRALAVVGEVTVDDVPVDPVLAADMAEGEVRRQLVEAVGRDLSDAVGIARGDRVGKGVGMIVIRRQPFGSRRLDHREQVGGIGNWPEGRREDDRRGGRDRERRGQLGRGLLALGGGQRCDRVGRDLRDGAGGAGEGERCDQGTRREFHDRSF